MKTNYFLKGALLTALLTTATSVWAQLPYIEASCDGAKDTTVTQYNEYQSPTTPVNGIVINYGSIQLGTSISKTITLKAGNLTYTTESSNEWTPSDAEFNSGVVYADKSDTGWDYVSPLDIEGNTSSNNYGEPCFPLTINEAGKGELNTTFNLTYTPVSEGNATIVLLLSYMSISSTTTSDNEAEFCIVIKANVTAPDPLSKPEAEAATEIWSKGFTANWQALDRAASYQIHLLNGDTQVGTYTVSDKNTTSYSLTNLNPGTNYKYYVVGLLGNTSSPNSDTIEVSTFAAPTAGFSFLMDGSNVTLEEPTYEDYAFRLSLGDVTFVAQTTETVYLTVEGTTDYFTFNNLEGGATKIDVNVTKGTYTTIEVQGWMGSRQKVQVILPDQNGEIAAQLNISTKSLEEMGHATIEEMLAYYQLNYGASMENYYNLSLGYSAISLTVDMVLKEAESTGTVETAVPASISFNGQEIINSLNLDVAVYNAIGQMVVRSNENINMSSYPAGVYVIKAANGESMKIVK